MPILDVKRDELFEALGATYTEEEFDELCFQFGIELDDVTSEREVAAKMAGVALAKAEGDDAVLYKIDIPANRHDLLSLEGLTRALRVFLEKQPLPTYTCTAPREDTVMTVAADTQRIRPYVVCAVIRGLELNEQRYKSLIDMQDKLHQNICRRRTLVAIGTHDLGTLTGPFRYEARAPADICFQPLAQTRTFRADELMEFYKTDPSVKHIKPYVSIIDESPVYPVIYDAAGRVLSLPPIINGDHSKITMDTKNMFIECTGTDLAKAKTVLNILVTALAEYAGEQYTVEPVRVQYEDASVSEGYTTPDLSSRKTVATVKYINTLTSLQLDARTMATLLTRMQLTAQPSADGLSVEVDVPVTRPDVLHACDIAEDVAIAHGFDNIPRRVPATVCVGAQQPLAALSDALRHHMAYAGFTECLTMGLVAREDNYTRLQRADDGMAVALANPKSADFQIARTTLLSGLLKSLRANRAISVGRGVRLFEVSDVLFKSDKADTGAVNKRQLSALYAGPTAGFEIVHGLVDHVMMLLTVRVKPSIAAAASGERAPESDYAGYSGLQYYIMQSSDGAYFPGRCAAIMVERVANGKLVSTEEAGKFGVVHPNVLKAFDLALPASGLELDVQMFL